MPVEALDDIDLVKGTLRELGRMKFQQIAQELTDYEVFTKWFKRDKVSFESGIGIQRNLMARLPDIARHVGWTDEDQYSISDLMEQMQVPWRHCTVSWMWKRQEMLMNKGPQKIFDLVKERRDGAMLNAVEVFEGAGWSSPSSSSNKTEPWGLRHWIVKNATTGYNGGLPSGHSTIAGLDLVNDAPNFKNYTTTYSAWSQSDGYAKLRTMKRKTGFKSPIAGSDYTSGRRQTYRIYVNETGISAIEQSALSQNDSLGTKDVSPVKSTEEGDLLFSKHPIIHIPYLDDQTDDPVYFVNHGTFFPVILEGDFLREDDPIRDPDRHDWRIVNVDTSYNYLCLDRRRNGVMYKV